LIPTCTNASPKRARVERRQLEEIAFYPAHDKRQESPAYRAVHKHLVEELDLPCLVCGVRNSTLKVPRENPYRATAMETHHHVIEWALAKAVEPARFNKTILPHLRARHPDEPAYRKKAFTRREVEAWVDHSVDNLRVLCDVHHRAKLFGIHTITFPVWSAQAVLRGDFEAWVRRRLAERLRPMA
jgi:hypothetical protein